MLFILPLALIAGILPGGGLPVAVVALGFAGNMDPWILLTAVMFYRAANDVSEPIPGILLGVPGARAAQATILDGYPMARRGEAGVAIGASYTCTLVGGIIGAAALFAVLPIARELLRFFGSAEFFLLTLMGVLAVAVVSAGAFVKGALSAMFAFGIAMIGFSQLGYVVRADFGLQYLFNGIHIAPVVVGLFAIPEAMDLVISNRPVARERLETMLGESRKDVYKGMMIALQHKWLLTRSSLIGVFAGILPGVGATTAHWLSYSSAKFTEKDGYKTFGKGDVRGVIASDAPNNSIDGGELIPTLVFGIPGSTGAAILLAILMLSGFQPGPAFLKENLDLTMAFIYILILGNVIVVPIMLWFAPVLVRVAAIPPNVLAPIVIGIVTLSAFMATNDISALAVVMVFALLGIFMKKYGWPRPPLLIALVLAEPLERFMWISVNTYGLSMIQRPQFLLLLAGMLSLIFVALRMMRAAKEVPVAEVEETNSPNL